MKPSYVERLNAALMRIAGAVPAGASEAQQHFVRRFFLRVAAPELEKLRPSHAAALALSAHSFMQERRPGEPKIRVFIPSLSVHGYENRRLVIELANDDMPFLLDSLTAELTRLGFTLLETHHPIFHVKRGRQGQLEQVAAEDAPLKGGQAESFIHFEVAGMPAGMNEDTLEAALRTVLASVRAAVEDWKKMSERAKAMADELAREAKKAGTEAAEEAAAFMQWLQERNFVFLGYADADVRLGVCREEGIPLTPAGRFLTLSISKSDSASRVHRAVLMDVVTLALEDGRQAQFYGLFTSSVYYQSVEAIPLVRRKLERVMEASRFDPVSHDGKALKAIMEFLPRDEIFQTSEDELLEVGLGLLALEAKPGVRLFSRQDAFGRYVSCMVYVPREHFSTQLRMTIIDLLAGAYQGQAEVFTTQMTESALARLHVVIRLKGPSPQVDVPMLERDIARFTHLWGGELKAELLRRFDEAAAEGLYAVYVSAFPQNYVSRYDIGATVCDIEKVSQALSAGTITLDFYVLKSEPGAFHLKIFSPGQEVALSDILPMLENMGFRVIDEHPFLIKPRVAEAREVWIRDIKLMLEREEALDLPRIKPLVEDALLRVWHGGMENDRFNALVIKAGLDWRRVTLLRAYAAYSRQIGFAYPQASIEQALINHASLAAKVTELFHARFDPAEENSGARQAVIMEQIEAGMAGVSSLADDRTLRHYVQLIRATLRTNYFQVDESGAPRPVLSFKFRSQDVPGMPKPVPFAEIFVYGMRVEGIHLRSGKVARGGLRWSDRHEDYRTEVLGLMKAQIVKNSVIVPVGSKGGFVVKRPPKDGAREAMQAEGIACYKLYLSGLLDLTDNIVDGEVRPPRQLVRHDENDPYLVVAADKGTASFSDIANGMSQVYGFWLDDAFASGGSAGYDHKEMGITARGAWISVVRHFREIGVDIAKQAIRVAGIGDMSGDVFGNGMLLSDNIQLIAAFDHRHIFLDPAPDAKASFEERKRLFYLPRSSWKDYDEKKISRGGGVYDRAAKAIQPSREAREALKLDKPSYTPDELIRAILTAPVDLLWNGGIGTYVKAESETHEQVGDRANNAVRVNGGDLRCKVVGEGGNLGFTQKGRVEYALGGGRLNTDAIDNSAGVDCSDHEVNIKIAFSDALRSGALSREKRNVLLEKMTDEVAQLVLKDNTLQTQALTLAQAQGVIQLESQGRLIRLLERDGLLDRALEHLPSDRELKERFAARQGLTRPELAVLLAYSKVALYGQIIASSLPDEPYFAVDLMRYFPKAMQKDFSPEISRHRLKREIVATVMTNSMVNRAGLTFFFDMQEDTALPTREIAAAYAFARDAFDLRTLWLDIERQAGQADAAMQAEMLLTVNRMIERVTLWALRNLSHPMDVEAAIAAFKPGIQEFRRALPDIHSPTTRQRQETARASYTAAGVAEALAAGVAALEMLGSACDVIRVAQRLGRPMQAVGGAYFALGELLHLGWLGAQAQLIPANTHWDRLAQRGLVQDLADEQQRLAASVLKAGDSLEVWAARHGETLTRYQRLIDDLKARATPELSALLVALKHVRMLTD